MRAPCNAVCNARQATHFNARVCGELIGRLLTNLVERVLQCVFGPAIRLSGISSPACLYNSSHLLATTSIKLSDAMRITCGSVDVGKAYSQDAEMRAIQLWATGIYGDLTRW